MGPEDAETAVRALLMVVNHAWRRLLAQGGDAKSPAFPARRERELRDSGQSEPEQRGARHRQLELEVDHAVVRRHEPGGLQLLQAVSCAKRSSVVAAPAIET